MTTITRDQLLAAADARGMGDITRSLLDSGKLEILDMSEAGPRSLATIAGEIMGSPWYRSNASIYARDYVQAMASMRSINDQYFADTAESVVRYALSNMTTWRGDQARAIKAELKDLLKGVK
jgi:hypothetical protein